MIVYGKHRRKYSLYKNPVSQDYDGAVYAVAGNSDILVKVYLNEYRTAEKEKEVIDTVNGICSMLGEMPIDVVYSNGRFVGYIFENGEESFAVPMADPIPVDIPPLTPSMGKAATILSVLGIGLVFSFLVYFLIFEMLTNVVNEAFIYWNFNGIPMILGGCGLMLFAFLNFSDRGYMTLVISAIAYILGSAVVFGCICLLVAAFTFTANLISSLLPAIIGFAATAFVIYLFIKMIKNIF